MPDYNIKIWDYESHTEINLTHEKEFTQKEINRMLADAIFEANKKNYMNNEAYDSEVWPRNNIIESLFYSGNQDDIINVLCTRYGFTPLLDNYTIQMEYVAGSIWGTGECDNSAEVDRLYRADWVSYDPPMNALTKGLFDSDREYWQSLETWRDLDGKNTEKRCD